MEGSEYIDAEGIDTSQQETQLIYSTDDPNAICYTSVDPNEQGQLVTYMYSDEQSGEGGEFVMLQGQDDQAQGGQYIMDAEGNVQYVLVGGDGTEDGGGQYVLDEAAGQIEMGGVIYQIQQGDGSTQDYYAGGDGGIVTSEGFGAENITMVTMVGEGDEMGIVDSKIKEDDNDGTAMVVMESMEQESKAEIAGISEMDANPLGESLLPEEAMDVKEVPPFVEDVKMGELFEQGETGGEGLLEAAANISQENVGVAEPAVNTEPAMVVETAVSQEQAVVEPVKAVEVKQEKTVKQTTQTPMFQTIKTVKTGSSDGKNIITSIQVPGSGSKNPISIQITTDKSAPTQKVIILPMGQPGTSGVTGSTLPVRYINQQQMTSLPVQTITLPLSSSIHSTKMPMSTVVTTLPRMGQQNTKIASTPLSPPIVKVFLCIAYGCCLHAILSFG